MDHKAETNPIKDLIELLNNADPIRDLRELLKIILVDLVDLSQTDPTGLLNPIMVLATDPIAETVLDQITDLSRNKLIHFCFYKFHQGFNIGWC